jgi:hypothetical protein
MTLSTKQCHPEPVEGRSKGFDKLNLTSELSNYNYENTI